MCLTRVHACFNIINIILNYFLLIGLSLMIKKLLKLVFDFSKINY
jgi:hypothetical protein